MKMNKPTAPQTIVEFFNLLRAYFGDPQKELTARTKLDALRQTGTVDDYVVDFQELAVETRYQDEDLKHQFMVRLKEKIRDHCLLSNPPPYMMGEWMERAMMVQRQMDLSKAMRNGTNMAGAFQKKP